MSDKKRQILQAASAVFREKGFHAAGMRDIAGALGMTAGNLYYYFSGKQELLAFCQDEALTALLARVEEVRSRGLRADAQLYLLTAGHVELLNDEIPGSLAHLEVEDLDEAGRATILPRRDAYEHSFRQIVREGVEAGLFRPVEPKLAALAILGAINWTVKWFRPGIGHSAQEVGEAFAAQLVRGLLAPGVELELPPEGQAEEGIG